jgi:hypothetical protein
MLKAPIPSITVVKATLSTVSTWMGDRLQTGEPYKGLAGAAVKVGVLRASHNIFLSLTGIFE